MTPSAKYLHYLMRKKLPKKPLQAVQTPPARADSSGGFNIHDFDIDAKPPPELSALEIALRRHFGPPI